MIDFSNIIGFQWDAGNDRKNYDRHGVSQTEAEEVFDDPELLLMPDTDHSRQEIRYNALGVTVAGRRLHLTFTLRNSGTLIRVISARDMSREERRQYGPTT